MADKIIIDAENQVLGRMASRTAKELLKGEEVIIVNANHAVISGNPKFIKKKYLHLRQIGDIQKGPFYPRYPNLIVRRVVRGMLSWKKPKGREAYRRLTVYNICPKEFEGKAQKVAKSADELRCKSMTVKDLCIFLGAKKERLYV